MELFGTGEMERAHLVVWLCVCVCPTTRKPSSLFASCVCVYTYPRPFEWWPSGWRATAQTPTTTIGRIENVYRLTVTPLGDFLYGVALYAPSVCVCVYSLLFLGARRLLTGS